MQGNRYVHDCKSTKIKGRLHAYVGEANARAYIAADARIPVHSQMRLLMHKPPLQSTKP